MQVGGIFSFASPRQPGLICFVQHQQRPSGSMGSDIWTTCPIEPREAGWFVEGRTKLICFVGLDQDLLSWLQYEREKGDLRSGFGPFLGMKWACEGLSCYATGENGKEVVGFTTGLGSQSEVGMRMKGGMMVQLHQVGLEKHGERSIGWDGSKGAINLAAIIRTFKSGGAAWVGGVRMANRNWKRRKHKVRWRRQAAFTEKSVNSINLEGKVGLQGERMTETYGFYYYYYFY
ncbi:unnamed protein product [Linum trigynum]|uniref:Uncharacterized protein n=1 Tax=Linum trigynum TaxID=586398 RepID=A0AAV2CXA7_9ROSI